MLGSGLDWKTTSFTQETKLYGSLIHQVLQAIKDSLCLKTLFSYIFIVASLSEPHIYETCVRDLFIYIYTCNKYCDLIGSLRVTILIKNLVSP